MIIRKTLHLVSAFLLTASFTTHAEQVTKPHAPPKDSSSKDSSQPSDATREILDLNFNELIKAVKSRKESYYTVNGLSRSFRISESYYDNTTSTVHFVGFLDNKPSNKIRLTIPQKSIAIYGNNLDSSDQPLSGSIVDENKIITIESNENSTISNIFGDTAQQKSKSHEQERINKIGLIFDALGEHKPESYSLGKNGTLTFVPKPEKLGIDTRIETKNDATKNLNRFLSYNPIPDTMTFSLESESPNEYVFQQYYKSIKIRSAKVRIILDKNKKPKRIVSNISTNEPSSNLEFISENEARTKFYNFFLKHGKSVDLSDPRYRVEKQLRPTFNSAKPYAEYYSLYFDNSPTDKAELLTLNVRSGEVKSTDISSHLTAPRVCDYNDGKTANSTFGDTLSCGRSTSIFTPEGTCNVTPTDPRCTADKFVKAYEYTRKAALMWEDLKHPGCCDAGANQTESLHVIPNTTDVGAGNAAYRLGYVPGRNNTYQRVASILLSPTTESSKVNMGHELGHAVNASVAQDVYTIWLDGVNASTSEKLEHLTVQEVIADIHTLIFQNYDKTPPFSNPTWTLPDNRSAVTPKHYPEDMVTGDWHASSQIGSHFFYKLVTNIMALHSEGPLSCS
ncbi:hypothetical protein [Simiduia agarivorans]|uniref:Uncharacterized protein n=1 Tax=Simiduia agarivorans (strain DSM 21679 / JCM 13881 / BCRC 17597 / SA1) TaxID=1117647 RepID=R9S526_SIMAS|nr:hypothetical protein [Simiduia agarivorans]AGN11281.1 hypothetical protein M5M_03012 [Simiduia agarivorans SA1 = DSM 21679]